MAALSKAQAFKKRVSNGPQTLDDMTLFVIWFRALEPGFRLSTFMQGNSTMKRVRKSVQSLTWVALAATLTLAACGGGGGGSSPSSSSTGVAVTGVAAKGLLKRARVEAFRPGSTTPVASTTTDEQGQYTLSNLPAGETFIIKVSVITGANGTVMVDEASNQEVTPPADFTLRAATVAQEGGTNSVQITPFSEMAVAKALAANPSLPPSVVEQANADIRSFVGFDILTERPTFNNNGTAPANKAALMLAAVSQLAADSANATALGCSTGQVADKIKCVVEKMADAGTADDDLVSRLDSAKETVASDDYDGEDAPPVLTKQPTELTPLPVRDAVAEAKALMANVRANGQRISGSAGGDSLDRRVRAVSDLIEAGANPVGDSSRELYSAIVTTAEMLDEGVFRPANFTINKDAALSNGCSFFVGDDPSADNWNTLATSADDASSVGCRLTYRVFSEVTGQVTSWYAYQHAFRVVRSSTEATYTVYSRLIKQKLNTPNGPISSDTPTYLAPQSETAYRGSVVLGRTFDGYPESFEMTGEYAGGLTQVLEGFALKNTVSLTLRPTYTPQYTRLSMVGRVYASGGSKPQVDLEVLPGSHVQSKFDETNTFNGIVETDLTQREGHLLLSAKQGQATITGTLDLTSFATTAAPDSALPSRVQFTGRVTDGEGLTLFEGTLLATAEGLSGFNETLSYSSQNQLASAQVRFTGDLFVPNAPRTLVDLILAMTVQNRYDLTGSYTQGDTRVLLTARGFEGTEEGAFFELSTPSGMSVRVTRGQNLANITKSDVVIGTVNVDDALINYRDGSYERY